MSDWWYRHPRHPKSPPPLPAEDGIRARSRGGEIGEKWWSRRFIAAMETVTDSARLRRGRSYARTGQVMDPRVDPGLVTSQVQGSRRRPYEVRAAIRPFSENEWAHVEDAMTQQAIFMAALLAGEMPADIEDAFAAAGLDLFPARPADIETECSCPDWANPCKHIAATLYILAEAFDDDPFLILTWRGRGKHELIRRLRERRAAPGGCELASGTVVDPAGSDPALAGAAEPAGGAAMTRPGAGRAREDAATGDADTPGTAESATRTSEVAAAPTEESPGDPLPISPGEFWCGPPEADALGFSPRAAAVPDAVLRELGPAPVEFPGGETLTALLEPAYATMTVAAERRAFGGKFEKPELENPSGQRAPENERLRAVDVPAVPELLRALLFDLARAVAEAEDTVAILDLMLELDRYTDRVIDVLASAGYCSRA